jgi:polyisoprenoid-binding protein YceI
MRRRSTIAAVLAALALVGATPATHAATPAPVHAACTSAVIEGKHKCIARGQFCRHTKKANRDYHRYGYHCGKKDKNGRYHLVYH